MKKEEQNIVVNHYTNTYQEENRFEAFSQKIEYITTMRYIEKYLKPGVKILEVGAGTGAYSIELAKTRKKTKKIKMDIFLHLLKIKMQEQSLK